MLTPVVLIVVSTCSEGEMLSGVVVMLCAARDRPASWLVLSTGCLRRQTTAVDATDSTETTGLDHC